MKKLLFIAIIALTSCQKKKTYTCTGWDAENNVTFIEKKQMTQKEVDKYNKGWYLTDTAGNVMLFQPNCR